MKSLFQLLLISFLFNHAVSVASEQPCDEGTLKIVADFLKLRDFHLYDGQTGIVVSQACKQSPLNTSITLASFAYQWPNTATQTSSGEGKKVIVAVVDRTKQQLVSRYQADIEEDALTEFGENSFKIDTARYQLAHNVRAFGVRIQSNARGPSCAERHWEDELILFVPNGEKLEPVFSMPMAVYQAVKGGMGGCSNEETISDNVGLTLRVKNSSHHGYADLLLSANIERYTAENSASEHRSERFLMQFDGQRYSANQKSKPWWVFDKAVLIK